MPNWSAAQKEAIESVGRNIVVSASAGSGKTAVLTARMVKRITQDRIPVENLLAMTFTDAAASEMKSRLYAGLNDVMMTTDDLELKDYCARQCATMASAMICTIHSFCLQVIQENYFVIGLPVKQIERIFSDDEMLIIKNAVMEETLSKLFHEDSQRFQLAASHFSGRADDFKALKETIEKIVNTAMNQPEAEAFFQQILEKTQQPTQFEELDADIRHYLTLRIQLNMNQLKTLLDKLLACCMRENLDDEVVQSVQLKLNKLMPVFDILQELNYAEFIRILRNMATSPLKNAKSEEYKLLRKQVNECCQELVESYFDSDELFYDNQHLQPIVYFLVDAARIYMQLLTNKKRQEEGLDFSDMEHLAYEILQADQQAVAVLYRERFDEILVDEFQDTNDFQNSMIELISRGNNVFRVGDIKQSIYRFRNAKPQIMADLMKCPDDQVQTIVLHHNYRSNHSIVEFNNLLFDRLMNIEGLNNEFSDNDHAMIGTTQQDDQYRFPVQFIKITTDSEKAEGKLKNINPKAMILAQKIMELKQTTEFNHWRDYCVLVRSHAIKDEIRFVFDTFKIPYTTTLQTGFFKTYSIRILTAYLELLCDSNSNIPCVSVLTGIYGFTDEQLAQLQSLKKTKSFFDVAIQHQAQFKVDYYHLKLVAKQEGLLAVIREILKINDFYWQHLDNQERANVDLFIQKAQKAEGISNSIPLFLKQIHNCIDEPSNTAVSASKADDVVQITTVHQSKGLQYPVVFFWSGSKTVINDELSACMVDEKLGLGLYHLCFPYRYKRATLQRLAIMTKNALEEFEENVRLYYVALTRAQKVGYIIDTVKEDRIFEPCDLSTFFAKKGSTDLILSAMSDVQSAVYHEQFISDDYRFETSEIQEMSIQPEIPHYPTQLNSVALTFETPSSYDAYDLDEVTFKETVGAKHGSRLHKAIENLPACPWSRHTIEAIDPVLSNQDVEALLKLQENDYFRFLNQLEFKKEVAFATKTETVISHGFIDFLAIDSENVYLVDFKSDWNVTDEILLQRYRGQMKAYIENLKRIFPNKTIHAHLYSLTLHQFISV